MNKSKIIIITLGLSFLLNACDDAFMDRTPKDRLSPATYFQTENELRTYVNRFYTALPSDSEIFGGSCNDNKIYHSVPDCIRGTRTVPVTGGGWSWGALRNINFFLDHINTFPGDDLIKNHYEGVARFFRAYFYFEKVKLFGDVPWYDTSIGTNDYDMLFKARDPRSFVMESVLEDLDFAIQHLRTAKSTTDITRWTALALKSRAMLFEGTFGKYHGFSGYEKFLEESVSASRQLMEDSDYNIYGNNPETSYRELFIANDAITDEIILAREYNNSIPFNHSVNFHSNSGSFGQPGLNKTFVNTYLMKDGTRFTDLPDYDKKTLFEETQNRDPRLSQTVRTPGYKQLYEEVTSVPQFAETYTGYQLIKYVTERDRTFNCENDLPIFRFAEVLLNYAEAKAELGTLSQSDLDNSVQLIRDRVGMPGIDMAMVNANPDPYLLDLYGNVSGPNTGVILEIRRERAIELVREGHRWWDLMRWKEGQLVTRTFYGLYFPGPGEYDLYNEGKIDLVLYVGEEPENKIDRAQYYEYGTGRFTFTEGLNGGYMVINGNVSKIFDETRDYLYPIPIQELTLNPNFVQNPGW